MSRQTMRQHFTDDRSYVINSDAQKKMYATMKGRPNENSEPRDLGREWHSDSLYENCPRYVPSLRKMAVSSSEANSEQRLQLSSYARDASVGWRYVVGFWIRNVRDPSR